jgi:hypothetical protein
VTAVVFAMPYAPPAPPAPKWQGYRMTWTGADGSTWDLDGSGGVLLLQEGLVGLHMPAYDRFTSSSPARPGRRHRGSRAKERSVEWNLLVWNDQSSEGWRELDRAFWDSFHPDIPGTWTVTDPRGRALSLQCRFVGPDAEAFAGDPSKRGWALYSVQMVADDPYWIGAPIEQSWRQAPPVAFFDLAGAPPFQISSGAGTADAVMMNPGDVEAYPVWTVRDVMLSLSITVDGGELVLPAVAKGQTLTVDTDPAVALAILTDVDGTRYDVSGAVDPWDPRPIPPGADVPLLLVADGFGTITARIVPRYRRGV